MADPAGLISILTAIPNLGVAAAAVLIFIVWYFDRRDFERYRQTAEAAISEQRQMYQNNVALVRRVTDLAESLNNVVILNTETMSKMYESMRTNQYCPYNRKDER